MSARPKVVFISCGQVTEEEKVLGTTISKLVEELTPFKGYLAQNQSSLEGLTDNVLKALNSSIGLIIVMHPRGTVSELNAKHHTRGSVWIEQEIAIAAFLSQVLHKKLKVAAYVHRDIKREGMRDELQLNPVLFERNDEVLIHLVNVLHNWRREEEEDKRKELLSKA